MITIEDLINKIKWDEREDPADYSLFYIDRMTKKLVEITKIWMLNYRFSLSPT